MKRLVFCLALAFTTPLMAEQLPTPVKLEVTRGHIFSFDKESLTDNPYFKDVYSAGDKFSFDGETLTRSFGENTLTNKVRKFVKTENKEDNTWQYIITLDSKGQFPINVEIQFLPSSQSTFIYPLVDDTTGDFFGVIVSECKVMP